MKREKSFQTVKSLIFAITIFAWCANTAAYGKTSDTAGAKDVSEKAISIITDNLTKRLRADLADNSVTVKINDVEKYQAVKNEIDIKGSGICIITKDNNRLPLNFEAKLSVQEKLISGVKYDFVQYETSAFAPTLTEEVLMKQLMNKVSADYKTKEIVIAIDGFETAETAEGKEYTGNGEIKIGEVEWRKIKFDVVLNAGNQPAKIEYDVQK